MTHSATVFTSDRARREAERCLQCFDAPCITACPVHIDIPKYIAMIKSGNVGGAAEVVKTSNALANTCGKVCPQEIYCQSVCNRAKQDEPVRIRELHFYATQFEARTGFSPLVPFSASSKRVAVVGGGPSGLACAFELRKLGYQVTLFDARGIGGVPAKSIPSFRLAQSELKDDLEFLSPHFVTKGKEIAQRDLARLRKAFDAVYLGIGLGKDRPLGIPGERDKRVVPVLKFLEAAKQGRVSVGKRVIVIGGGNVSLDAAATAKRFGAREVQLLYRRSEREMKVWKSELDEARRQGVELRVLTAPVEIIGRSSEVVLHCRRMRLSRKKDSTGRPIPVEVRSSDFMLAADMIIVAIGQVIGSDLVKHFRLNGKGFIKVDGGFRTSVPGVFAGGDAISGEGTIVQSVAHGLMAAYEIDEFLSASGGWNRGVRA